MQSSRDFHNFNFGISNGIMVDLSGTEHPAPPTSPSERISFEPYFYLPSLEPSKLCLRLRNHEVNRYRL